MMQYIISRILPCLVDTLNKLHVISVVAFVVSMVYDTTCPQTAKQAHFLPNGSTFCIMTSPRVVHMYPLMLYREMELVNPKDSRSCLLLHASLIFCPRCILNSSLTFLERVRWSIGLPSFLYDLFILYIALYAVLGDIPLMLKCPVHIIGKGICD